jgi:hypothetical protein
MMDRPLKCGVRAGGTAVAGFGVSGQAGTAGDADQVCVVNTICGLIGPMVGGFVSGGYSVGTGKVTPGDVSWSIGGVGSATVGVGGKAEVSIANDGGVAVQGGPSMGGSLGGALQVCRQETTKTCSKK